MKALTDDLMPDTKRRRATSTPSFSQCFDRIFTDCGWFAEDTWAVWRIVGKAIFGEPMTPDELEVFQAYTGRSAAPTRQAREVWCIAGRRGGKGWFASSVAVYLAHFRPPTLKKGTKGRAMILAVDQDQANETFDYVCNLLDAIGARTKGRKQGRVTIVETGIEILVKPADRKRVRGRTLIAIIADEVASWWNDQMNANPDYEVFRALKPSTLGVSGALLMVITSPYARKGTVYDAFVKNYGVDDRTLVWKAPTWVMRPPVFMEPEAAAEFNEFLDEERAKDPVSFSAEYGAEFRTDVESFVSIEILDAVTVADGQMPTGSGRLVLFGDLAGGAGQDSAAIAIADPGRVSALVHVEEWKPPFDAVTVARAIADLAKQFGVRELVTDSFGGATFASIFREVAPGLVVKISERTTSENYSALVPLLTGRKVAIPVNERLRGQLLVLERRTTSGGREVITHPQRGHDDVATASAGALVIAAERGSSPSAGFTSGAVLRAMPGPGRGTDTGKGAAHLGGDTFMAPNGEMFRDARGL